MDKENGCFHTNIKKNKPLGSLKKQNSRNNIKRNLILMNDPAFHLNKTLKEYISTKLDNNSTAKNTYSKDFERTVENKMQRGLNKIIQKVNERYNNFKRIKTMSNILSQNNNNNKKNISKKKK